MKINLLGKEIWLGFKPDDAFTKEEAEAFIEKEVAVLKKSFTYDKLFTTGHMMDVVNSTRVTNPYETISNVYKSIKAIVDNVSEAEPALFKKLPNGKNGDLVDDPIFHQFLNKPNSKQNFTEFREEWIGFYELHGEGFMQIVPSIGQMAGTYGLPAEIFNLNPAYMQEVVDPKLNMLTAWRYKNGQIIDPRYVIHTKDFNPYNQWRGLAPIKAIYSELMIDSASINWNLEFFRNDATPGFALSTDDSLNDDQRNRLEEWWERRHKGTRNAFKMAVFEKGLKPVTITPNHKDMDFVNQKELTRKEIMGVWRVPEALFNMTKDVNYATMMGQMRVFWIYTLIPALGKFESTMNKGIITPYRSDVVYGHDLSGVAAFQEQLGDLLSSAKELWALGYTADEINEKLNLGMPKGARNRALSWVPWNIITTNDAIDNPRMAQTVNDPTGINPISAPDPGKKPPKEKPPAELPAEPDPAKAAKAAQDAENKRIRRDLLIKSFNRRQTHVEDLFKKRMEGYFKKLAEIAKKTPDHKLEKGIVAIDWHRADLYLEKLIKPVMVMAVQAGVSMGKENVAAKKSIDEGATNQSLESFVAVKMQNITDLNATVKDQLSSVLQQVILDGQSHSVARDALLANMTDAMSGVFDNAVTRAALIARTETVGAVNGGGLIYYAGIGVEGKAWITAHDDEVRDSHASCEDQGEIKMDAAFENGLMYPGDPNGDADEVCNCRCVLAPSSNY